MKFEKNMSHEHFFTSLLINGDEKEFFSIFDYSSQMIAIEFHGEYNTYVFIKIFYRLYSCKEMFDFQKLNNHDNL